MKSDDEQLMLRIALHQLPGIGPVLARNLVSYCGSVENVFSKKKSQLEKIPGIGSERAAIIGKHKNFEKAAAEVKWIRKNDVQSFYYLDENYPKRLKECDDAPALLFAKGNMNLDSARTLAVVGTRHITTHGKHATEKLIRDLSDQNIVIISGLAYGVDVTAHQAAIKYGIPTIGVIAHGIDKVYPKEHINVASRMLHNGGLVTEYMHGTKAEKDNFPARNRIVAGLSDAVLVIESAKRGGALITAEIAGSYNRDVFAMPGRITDQFSSGCNDLIRTNRAMLIESAAHLLEAMQWDEKSEKVKASKQLILFRDFTPSEKAVVDSLREKEKVSIDDLSLNSGIPLNQLSGILLQLEFDGLVRSLPGKVYCLI